MNIRAIPVQTIIKMTRVGLDARIFAARGSVSDGSVRQK
jgi:hypothetical protein